jgi:uncharacterized protein (DUF2336 family)
MQTLPIMDELEAALAGGTDARRIEMLTRITDLFVGGAARFTEAQTGVFDDIMVRLVSAIEAKARAKLAHRLAPIANAPLNTIHMLAFDDDIEVAATGLAQSERWTSTPSSPVPAARVSSTCSRSRSVNR